MLQPARTWADDEEDDFNPSEKRSESCLGEKEAMMAVKIKITKKQLHELLGNKRMPIEKALEEIMRKGALCRDRMREAQWRPRLQSIPEGLEER